MLASDRYEDIKESGASGTKAFKEAKFLRRAVLRGVKLKKSGRARRTRSGQAGRINRRGRPFWLGVACAGSVLLAGLVLPLDRQAAFAKARPGAGDKEIAPAARGAAIKTIRSGGGKEIAPPPEETGVIKDVRFKEGLDIYGKKPDKIQTCLPTMGRPKALFDQLLKIQERLIKDYAEVEKWNVKVSKAGSEYNRLIRAVNQEAAVKFNHIFSVEGMKKYNKLIGDNSARVAGYNELQIRHNRLRNKRNSLRLNALRLEHMFYISLRAGKPSLYALTGLLDNFQQQRANQRETLPVVRQQLIAMTRQQSVARQLSAVVAEEARRRGIYGGSAGAPGAGKRKTAGFR